MITKSILDYPLLERHIEEILAIENEAKDISGDKYDAASWGKIEFLSKRKEKDTLSCCISEQNKIIGFSIAYEVDERSAHISRLAIAVSQHSKGYATQLLDFQLEIIKSKGYDFCSVDLSIENIKAFKLYERKGFKKLGEDNLTRYVDFRKRDKHEYLGTNPTHIAMVLEI